MALSIDGLEHSINTYQSVSESLAENLDRASSMCVCAVCAMHAKKGRTIPKVPAVFNNNNNNNKQM